MIKQSRISRMAIIQIFSFVFLNLLFIGSSYSKVRITDFSLDPSKNQQEELRTLKLKISGDLNEKPELIVNSYMVQLTLKNAIAWPKIEKRVNFAGKEHDTTLMAYQYEKDTVRVRAIFPQKVDKLKDKIEFQVVGNEILLKVPRLNKVISSSDVLDESYLRKIIKENEEIDQEKPKKNQEKDRIISNSPGKNIVSNIVSKEDPKKSIENKIASPSLSSDYLKQIIKFMMFTIFVLALFYGLVYLIKKTVLGKGRLAGLNNGQIVTVLGQNYIGPKRSLVTVKVNKQIFLLSNSENGIHFLSEITDTTGIIKESEKIITGSNFDNEFSRSSGKGNLEDKITLKSNINESHEKVTFSKQIKEKVKGLKPIHQ